MHRLISFVLLAVSLPTMVLADSGSNYEARLVGSVNAVVSGNQASALSAIDSLKTDFPLSRIAHLLQANVLLALSGKARSVESAPEIAELREQLRLRWQHAKTLDAKKHFVPAKLLQISDTIPFVLYADLPSSRLHVFAQQNGGLVRLSDYYITIGRAGFGKEREGDLKTPVGVYHVDGYIPGTQLHARYGAGALTTDYPNTLDRFLNRTGYGIWLHGTEPGWINRGPRASEGCITLSNPDFEELVTQLGSHRDIPIVIDDNPEWIEAEKIQQARNDILTSIIKSADRSMESLSGDHHEAWTINDGVNGTAVITDLVLYPGKQERLLARWMTLENQAGATAFEQYWHRAAAGEWQMTLQISVPVRSPERFAEDVVTPEGSAPEPSGELVPTIVSAVSLLRQ